MILPTFTVMESEETPKTRNDNVQKSENSKFEHLLDNNIDSDGKTLEKEMIDIADEDIDEEDTFSDESLRLKLSDDENECEDTVAATESNAQFPVIKQETSFENDNVGQELPKSNAICKKADQSLGKKNDDAERKENVWCDGNERNSSSDKLKSTDGQSAFSGTFCISRAPTWARDGVTTANGVCPQLNSSTKSCSNNHADHGKRKRLRNGYTYSLNRHVRVQYFRGKSKSSTASAGGCSDNVTKDGDKDDQKPPQSSVERDINSERESGTNETNGNKDCDAKFPSASKAEVVDDSGNWKNDLNVELGCSNVVADDNSVTAPIQNHDDSTDQSPRLTSKMNNSGDSIPLPNELGKECIHLNLDAECESAAKEVANTDDTANTSIDHNYDPSVPKIFTVAEDRYETNDNTFSEDCELDCNEARFNLDGEANHGGSLYNGDHEGSSNDANSKTKSSVKTTTLSNTDRSPKTLLHPESAPTLVDLELVTEDSTEHNPVEERSIDKPLVESLEAVKKSEPVKENMVSGDNTILEVQSSEVYIAAGKTSQHVGTVLPEVATSSIMTKRKKRNKKKRRKQYDAPFNFEHLTSVLKLNKLGIDAAPLPPMKNGSTPEMKIVRKFPVEQVDIQKTITDDKDPSGKANADEAGSIRDPLECHEATGNDDSVGRMIIDEQPQTRNEDTVNMKKDHDIKTEVKQESEDKDNALLASKATNKRPASVALAEEVSQGSKVTDEMILSKDKRIVKSTDTSSEVRTEASTITKRRGSASKRNFSTLETLDEATNHKKMRRTSLPTKLSDTMESEGAVRARQTECSNRTLSYVRKFFQRDGSGKLVKLKPEEMEELLIQKIVETITMRSEIGKLREQARISERNQEATRLRCQQLAKQIKDFELVLSRNAVERRNNNDKPVPPIKINRSVGLQVNFTTEYGLQNLRTLNSCPPPKPIPPPVAPVVTGPSNVPIHNGVVTPTPEKIVQPRTSVSPRGSIKIRSPRRPEVPTSLTTMVQTPVTTVITTVAAKPTEPPKPTPAVNNVRPSTIVVSSQISQASPPVPPLVPTSVAAKLQSVVLNGKVTLHTSPAKNVATTQKTKQNEMIDLTEEEDKNKITKSNPPSLVSIVTTTAPTAIAPKPMPARLQRIFQTIPANIQPRNIRVVQNASQPTPTALVNNINATTLAYVMQANPAVGRQLLITPHGNQLRPMLSPRPQYSTVTYKPATTTIPNGTVRTQITTTNAASTLQHPAPLPDTPYYPKKAGFKSPPPPPSLKISKVKQGIILSWNMALSESYAEIASYQLYAYQEIPGTPPSTSLWKKVGDVRALPLPMACTLKEFTPGNKYHFAVRAVDAHTRLGQYSTPGNIAL